VEKLIPSIDGNLFLFDSYHKKLEKVGVDIQELVQRAPTITQEHAWTGSKTARMFVIDLETGQVLRELANDFFLEQEKLSRKNVIFIGRADYEIKGSDRSGNHTQLWNMSYGKYIADDELELDEFEDFKTFEIGEENCIEAFR
jgi:hypothetical protein